MKPSNQGSHPFSEEILFFHFLRLLSRPFEAISLTTRQRGVGVMSGLLSSVVSPDLSTLTEEKGLCSSAHSQYGDALSASTRFDIVT